MNKNMKIGIIAGAVAVIGGIGAGVYYRIDQLQQKKDYFEAKFNKTKGALPKVISIEKTSESTFSETNVKYVIQIEQNGKKSESKLVIESKLEHGFNYLLSGEIEGTATGKIEGPFAKEFKSLDKLFDSTIKISSDDNLTTDTKFADLIAKDGTEMKGISSHLELVKADDTMKSNFKIASLNSPKTPDGQSMMKLTGFELEYSGKTEAIGNNSFSTKINEIQSPFGSIKGASISANSTVSSGNVNVKVAVKATKIDVPQLKDGSVDLQYSIKNLDESVIKALYEIGRKTAPNKPEDIEKSMEEFNNQAKKLITHGLEFSIDKFNFKSGQDSLDFKFNASLPKVKSFDDVSFEKGLKLNYNINAQGMFAEQLVNTVNGQLNSLNTTSQPVDPSAPVAAPTEQPTEYKVENGQFKLDFEVSEAKGKINGKELTSAQNDVLHIILSTVDERLHGKKTDGPQTTQELLNSANPPAPAPVENSVITAPEKTASAPVAKK